MRRTRALIVILAATLTCAQAQWLNHPDSRTPRTKDGRPDLSARTPRLNGKPDLSGLWQSERTSPSEFARVLGPDFTRVQVDAAEVTKHYINVFWDLPPGQEPIRPEGIAIFEQRLKSGAQSPSTYCLPESLPGAPMVVAFKMIQAPTEIVVLFENNSPPRQIYTDGRKLPQNPEPSWMGYSTGKWEGDTLVVETTGITERAWLDAMGHPHSEAMRITERYRRRDFGHMDLEVTIDDPKYYTRPFGFKTTLTLIPDSDVLEYICAENEKDRTHIVP